VLIVGEEVKHSKADANQLSSLVDSNTTKRLVSQAPCVSKQFECVDVEAQIEALGISLNSTLRTLD